MSRIGRLLALALMLGGQAWSSDDEHEEEVLPAALAERASAPAAVPVPSGPPRLYVGANIGASLALARFGASVAPGMEAGTLLGSSGRLQPYLGFHYTGHAATGTADDVAFPDGYRWDLEVRAITLAPGLRVRILPWEERLSPEISAGPVLSLGEIVLQGEAAGAPFPEARQTRTAGGGFVSGGIAGRVGPGQLEGHVTVTSLWLDGDLTGPFLLTTVTPSIGYRVSR